LEFIGSEFYARAVERGDMLGTEVLADDAAGLTLVHPRISVPAYPWEWTQSQWLAAGELTIKLCREAVAEGWILKDATPLNILFVGARPVLVDVLSFERREPTSPIWLAYGQYVRTFLLPLLMNRMLGWPFELTLFKRDGYEPQESYRALSWGQRLSGAAFWPITLPAWLEGKGGGDKGKSARAKRQEPEVAAHVLNRMLDDLMKRTRRAVAGDAASDWAEYQSALTHYAAEESAQKRRWVEQVLGDLEPKMVLDIGANTGEYSALAARSGAQVIALERDAAAAERLFVRSRADGLAIQTIHADLARPTPPAGWELGESSGLVARLEQRCELVMMLAVIHHLVLMEQIPLPAILELCGRLTRRYLIVEWVPVSDPMFQSLMRGREELYGALTEGDLLAACDGRFSVMRREVLGNGRVLFLFEKVA
jgi:SAM-dependent methyltransferase